jgi:hypothetical protein
LPCWQAGFFHALNKKEKPMFPIKQSYGDNSLNQQVANKTGEDLETIRQLGFSPLGPIEIEERQEPLMVDWDLLAASR